MRIAHVSVTYPPHNTGTGNVAHANAAELSRRGHQVHAFTAQEAGLLANEIIDGVSVHRLRPTLRYGNAAFLPNLFSHLRNFDLIHIHLPFYGGAEAVLLRRLTSKTPLVITHHQDVQLSGLAGKISTFHDRFLGLNLMRQADRVCFTSLDYARSSVYAPFWIKENWPIVALPNGVDPDYFKAVETTDDLRDRRGWRGKFVILFVGVLDQAHYFKGVPILMEAVAHLNRPNIALVIVGKGEMRATYEKQAKQLNIEDRVTFAGFIPDENLPEYYQCADVTILPSTTTGEAFGLVLLESLASGTPVIASSLPGVRTVVTEGNDGFLFSTGDAADLTVKLNHLIDLTPQQRHFMGEAGRRKIEKHYTWFRIGQQLEDLYADILSDKGQRSWSIERKLDHDTT